MKHTTLNFSFRNILLVLFLFECSCVPAQRKRVFHSAQLTGALAELYDEVDSLAAPLVKEKPLIGISAGGDNDGETSVGKRYVQSVINAGGTPYLIPSTTDSELLRDIVSRLDGIVLTGGSDISPIFYNEEEDPKLEQTNIERDRFDFTLFKLANDRNVPILGICRGLQLINVALGGTLYQDLPTNHGSEVNHRPGDMKVAHSIKIAEGSVAEHIVCLSELEVNSAHHQAAKTLGFGLKVTGWSDDNIPEIIEGYPDKQILAVQFHPEAFAAEGDETFLKFFRFLVTKAETYHKAKEIMGRIVSVDTHVDTPMWLNPPMRWRKERNLQPQSLSKRGMAMVSTQKMDEGKLDAQFLAAFIGQGKTDDASSAEAVAKVNGIIDDIYQEVEKNSDVCGLAFSPEDVGRLKAEGKKAFFIGIENGYAIGKDIANIEKFWNRGVKYITLCHSYDNDVCHSSTHTEDASKGLTDFGREVVKEMNRLGMTVDLSHTSEGTFWEVLDLSTQPVICSHSSARALCNHNRNLTDEQLKALAAHGGVIQVCLLDSYINKDVDNASVTDAVNHIDHIVKVAGIDHVGIGSDFDGGGGLNGCNGDNDLINITVQLLERGYTEEDLAKLWGGNFFRVVFNK